MSEKIDSRVVVDQKGVSGAYVPGKLDVFLEHTPNILKLVFGFAIVAIVGYVCWDVMHSSDPDMKQFKQAAFTVLTGFGTGAIGFIFGVYSTKPNIP